MARAGNPTVLVVEDDSSIREVLQAVLDMDSYNVAIASNGQEALEQLKNVHPDLILLDLMMPVMNGWEFLSIVKREYPNFLETIPIVVVSAAGEAAKSAHAQASGYLDKPIDLADLERLLDFYCPLKENERAA